MKKIVFTGPESVGKSTLTKQISDLYDFPSVQELARQYLEKENRKYNIDDVLNIAKLQIEAEDFYFNNNASIVVLDTDLIVTKIWLLHCFNFCPLWIDEHIQKYLETFHLLCYPDIEWKFDPLRENPEIRLYLFEEYKKEIEFNNFNYKIIKNNGEMRVQNVCNAIDDYLNGK